jgi:hypothetical protein
LSDPSPTINLSQLPPNLHTLELCLLDYTQGKEIDSTELLGCVIPNLRTLILDTIFVSNPLSTLSFWRNHPGIERLELGHGVVGDWFDNFEAGMLPNLKYLQVIILYHLISKPLKGCIAV